MCCSHLGAEKRLIANYPLARNQYINNSPEIFSCIRTGANTAATCIRPEIISLENLANMQKMTPQKYFPVFARVRIQAPRVFAKQNNSPRIFSCMYWFCAGGYPIDCLRACPGNCPLTIAGTDLLRFASVGNVCGDNDMLLI